MSHRDLAELMDRLAQRRCVGWRYAELERILLGAGYQEVSRAGSHRTWKRTGEPKLFTVKDPGSGNVSPGYIRAAAKRILPPPSSTGGKGS